jgi:hypothetical protein
MDKGTGKGRMDVSSWHPSGLRDAGVATLFALASAVVLWIAFYGLNTAETRHTASARPTQSTHAPGGENSGADTRGIQRVKESGVKG